MPLTTLLGALDRSWATPEVLFADNKELYGKPLLCVQLFSFKQIALEPLLAALGPLLVRFPALGTSPPRVDSLLLNPGKSGPELLCYLSLYPWN